MMPSKNTIDNVTQNLAAAALGAAFLPIAKITLSHFFHIAPPDWANTAGANLFAAAILVPVSLGCLQWSNVSRARGDRFTIYVARIGGDAESEAARTAIVGALEREFGSVRAEIIPAGIEFPLKEGISLDLAANGMAKEGRTFLRRKGGDLLICGRLLRMGDKRVLELRFVSTAHNGEKIGHHDFDEKLNLDADFAPAMGTALASIAGAFALPVTQSPGKYLVQMLAPIADRLKPLIEDALPPLSSEDRITLFHSYGQLQSVAGKQSGDSVRLQAAVSAYGRALNEIASGQIPLKRAGIENSMGNVCVALGQQNREAKLIKKGIAFYRKALKTRTRKLVPLDWATTRHNLGSAFAILGEWEDNSQYLKIAVSEFRAALKERAPELVPVLRATTQTNLGAALKSLAEREGEFGYLVEALQVCLAAAQGFIRKQAPLRWAAAQHNLGNVLLELGRLESGTVRLKEAIAAFHRALKERTRKRLQLDWMATQHSLALAYAELNKRESHPGLLV